MAIILYARVSTIEQTVEHQLKHAKAAGFSIDDVVTDNGVSGMNTSLTDRPQGKRLFDILRKGDTLVVRALPSPQSKHLLLHTSSELARIIEPASQASYRWRTRRPSARQQPGSQQRRRRCRK